METIEKRFKSLASEAYDKIIEFVKHYNNKWVDMNKGNFKLIFNINTNIKEPFCINYGGNSISKIDYIGVLFIQNEKIIILGNSKEDRSSTLKIYSLETINLYTFLEQHYSMP